MRIKIRGWIDIFIGIFLAMMTTFGLPYLSWILINPNFTLNIGITILYGYAAWFLLWHYVWFIVDGLFDRVSFKFIIDSIKCVYKKIVK